jgi:hypothetical protein
MCFCFDGEGAVAVYRPPACERRPVASAPALLPAHISDVSSRLATAGSSRPGDPASVRHLAAAAVPLY